MSCQSASARDRKEEPDGEGQPAPATVQGGRRRSHMHGSSRGDRTDKAGITTATAESRTAECDGCPRHGRGRGGAPWADKPRRVRAWVRRLGNHVGVSK